MLILGIDPGLNITGYGLIKVKDRCGFTLMDAGFIETNSSLGMPKRLAKIYSELFDILEKTKPDVLVLEQLYAHYKHPLTASLLGHARGVICLLAEQKKIHFVEYPATRVKKVTTGNGHASKQQIQKMIEYILDIKKESLKVLDISDAISLAIAHAYISRFKP